MIARIADNLLLSGLAALVAVIAAFSLGAVASAGDVVEIASRIDRSVPVDSRRLELSLPFLQGNIDAPCDDRVDLAARKVALRDLNQRNAALDYEAWSNSIERTGRLLRRFAACSPLDGRQWAELALVERAQVAPFAQVAAYARFSERVSPIDFDILRRRLELWRTAPPALRGLIADVAERDMGRVLRWAYDEDVRAVMASVSPTLDDTIEATLPSLPPERRDLVRQVRQDLAAKAEPPHNRMYELPARPPSY